MEWKWIKRLIWLGMLGVVSVVPTQLARWGDPTVRADAAHTGTFPTPAFVIACVLVVLGLAMWAVRIRR